MKMKTTRCAGFSGHQMEMSLSVSCVCDMIRMMIIVMTEIPQLLKVAISHVKFRQKLKCFC